VDVQVPIIVRLTGTNSDIAQTMLSEYAEANKDKLNIKVVGDFDIAAAKAVAEASTQ